MKLKKILPLAISLSLMAGCSGKKQSATPTNEEIVTEIKNPVEITFWHAMNGDQEKSLQGLVDNFQKENPNIKVIGVEPAGASCMKASLDAGKVITLPDVNTIADGTAVKTPGDIVFPYIQKNIDEIIAVEDQELIVNFLDMMENHKMLVENSGLLTVAALKHLDCKGKKIVSILSGGNMDVITLSSVVQHGLIERGRVFTVSVQLPDRPGELVNVAKVIAKLKGNVIRLEHNQFVSINRNAAVELRITLEAFGHEHKKEIIEALKKHGYDPKEESPTGLYE